MPFSKFTFTRTRAALCLLFALTAGTLPVRAAEIVQSSGYELRLAGVPFAKVKFKTTRNDNLYNVQIDFKSTGLGEIVTDLTAELVSTGVIGEQSLQSRRYYLQYRKGNRHRLFETTYKDGNVDQTRMEPARDYTKVKNWVPVTPDDMKAVTDPVAALMAPASARPCQAKTSVFDGETRYDIFLEAKGQKAFKTKGFEGMVEVCAMRYVPKSGYREGRSDAEFLKRLKAMEIWFAKSEQLQLYAPVYFSVPTSFGTMTMKAVRFGG